MTNDTINTMSYHSLVALVDQAGRVVGSKERRDIQKAVDPYHSVFTLLITPDNKIILGKIPVRPELPNLYTGLLGAPAATMRRYDETADEAGIRAVKKELCIEGGSVIRVGEGYHAFSADHRKYMSVYYITHPVPREFNRADIEVLCSFTRDELIQELAAHPEIFAPTFRTIWDEYGSQILVSNA